MDIIKSDDFRREMKKGLSGGYLFFGEEDYLKLHTLNAARAALCPDEGFAFFNDMRIDPLELTPASLTDALMPLPMMNDKKIVSVSGIDLLSMRSHEIDALCEVLSTLPEYDFNVLIISAPSGCVEEGFAAKRASSAFAKLTKYLRPVQFDTPGQARLLAWCEKHFEHNGVSCSDDICKKLFERCGTSMFTLASEIDKLSFYAITHGRNTVTAEDIPLVTCSVVESDAFALANAILGENKATALDALAVTKFNRVEPVILLSEISKVICDLAVVKSMLSAGKTPKEISLSLKMNEYKVKIYANAANSKSDEKLSEALARCAEADKAIKNSAGGYDVLEQLLCTL